jgi:hypothetical protein
VGGFDWAKLGVINEDIEKTQKEHNLNRVSETKSNVYIIM